MKKFFKVFCLVILSLMLVGFVSPSLVAFADEQELATRYELLPANFREIKDPSEYNIAEGHTFGRNYNPFDEDKGQKCEGMSFSLPTTNQSQIENGYVIPLNPEIPEGDYSLFMWIHFDGLLVHDLDISLEFENGAILKWEFKQDELLSLIKKRTDLEIEVDPYSWNQFELPFVLADTTGEIFENQKLQKISKISVNYTSKTVEELKYSSLRFYDIYISDCVNENKINVIKQNYFNYSFNFIDEDIASGLIWGDSLKLKTKAEAINYAYQDDENLLTANETYVKWKIKLTKPSDNVSKEIAWGSTIDFNEEGTWRVHYTCVDIRQSDTSSDYETPIIDVWQDFYITRVNGVYFDSQSVSMKTGQSYVLLVHISNIFEEVSDFSFEYNPEEMTVEYLGEGTVKVTALKEGSFELVAKVSGTRKARQEESTYSNTITIKATEDKDEYGWLRITLWCTLGVLGVVLIAITIKILVKSRKIDVK